MRLRSLSLAGALALTVGVAGAASAGTTVVYSDPGAPLPGNQPWTYNLGQDFSVNTAVHVYSLGAFTDSGANSNIEVALYKLNDANPADGGSLVTITTVPGNSNIVGDYAFQDIAPVTLQPGFYQLQSFGGNPPNNNFNTGFTGAPNTDIISFNTMYGALSQGSDFYNGGGVAPGIATTSDTHWYAAASFAASVPETSAWVLMMTGLGGLGGMLRLNRRSALAAAA